MCKFLWIDNDAENLQPYADYLADYDMSITLESSPDIAFERIQADRSEFDLLLLDIKFYRRHEYPSCDSDIINGFDFLDRMKTAGVDIPVCVLSSFLHLKENEERLTDYTNTSGLRGMVLDKYLADVDSELFKISFVNRLVEFIKKVDSDNLEAGIQLPPTETAFKFRPFEIGYADYLSLNKVQQSKIRRSARVIVSDQLEALHKSEGTIWTLFIGDSKKAYRTATSVNDIPGAEEIQALAIERDRVPFQFRSGTLIEDRWGHCGSSIEHASYPKIAVSTKGHFNEGEWRVHFDSGTYESFFSLEEFVELGLFNNPSFMTEDIHRGVDFSFRRENVQFQLKDPDTEATIDLVATLNLVEDWITSPFLARCTQNCNSGQKIYLGYRNCVNRPGLIGRSFLIGGGLSVIYDPKNPILKVSTVD